MNRNQVSRSRAVLEEEGPGLAEEPMQSQSLVEIGWVISDNLNLEQIEVVREARRQVLETLRETFPQFQWTMPIVERNGPIVERTGTPGGVREPTVSLLEFAAEQRDVNRWDFALLITQADLMTYYKPYAMAALSRSLASSVVSLARIAPDMEDSVARYLAREIHSLVLHQLGHWNGLTHVDDPHNYMHDIQSRDDLLQAESWSPAQRQAMAEFLEETADLRLEELRDERLRRPLPFYLSALRTNWREISLALWEARPWELPLRLNRLFTAALASLLLLLVTAEVWELGANMPAVSAIGLSLTALMATVAYLLFRQRLLVRRVQRRLSEQRVITNASTVAIITAGVATTYALLFVITLLVAMMFMSSGVIARWAALADGGFALDAQLSLAAVVSSFGILIGSLGATFEGQNYFRHITLVDEET